MAKENTKKVSGDQVAPEQRDADGNPSAAKEGESLPVMEVAPIEDSVNPMTPGEEALRQQAEAYPRNPTTFSGQHEDGPEKARQGYASTSRARVGRVVVLHEDVEHEGEIYKDGVQDIEL